MNFRIFLLFSLLISSFNTANSQTEKEVNDFIKNSSEKQLVELNTNFLMEGFTYYADLAADRLLILNPTSANYHYRKGYSTLEVYKNHKKATEHFLKAVEKINNNYDMFAINEKGAPSDAIYYLAKCYHLNEEIDKAEENYLKFITLSRGNSELLPIAKLNLLQCAEAKKQMAAPVQVFLSNVGSAINSQFPDYSPVISLDGSALYFTSRRPWPRRLTEEFRDMMYNQYPEDIYVSYQDFDQNWMEPTRLKFCEPQRNEATVAVNTDERKIYLYMDSTGGGDIYYSDFYKAKFQDVKWLEIPGVNSDTWEPHAMMSHDGKRVFFVSDRKGGLGGRDIYYCDLLEDGEWSLPKNMGPQINTPYDEDSPFTSIDNKTLYFSSNGAKSIGGFDILKTKLNEDGIWSESVNLGYPFNSTNDDIYYTTTVDGLKGYMTSYRQDGLGEKDIYEIQNEYLGVQNISVLTGNINVSNDSKISEETMLQITLTCLDCELNVKRIIFPRYRDGFYISDLEPCKTYDIVYTNVENKIEVFRDQFKTSCDTTFKEIVRDLTLNPDGTLFVPKADVIDTLVPVVEKQEFKNPEFLQYLDFNKNKLSIDEGALKAYLDEIHTQLLEGREKITIDIYASASKVPTETFKSNELLAQKRAENVRADLENYFERTSVKNKVKINVLSALVQGPEYSGDSDNETKYGPYQYVGIKTK
jgi:tetratricopeptide (TPR) repeat protein